LKWNSDMKCEKCSAPAEVHVAYASTTDAAGRNPRERHLCIPCARLEGFRIENPMGMAWCTTESDTLTTLRAAAPVGPYPHAKRLGNLLFLSGVGPRKAGTDAIPGVTLDAAGRVAAYDIVEQCKSVFENVRVILEDAGSSWDKIVDVTVFLTDMKD